MKCIGRLGSTQKWKTKDKNKKKVDLKVLCMVSFHCLVVKEYIQWQLSLGVRFMLISLIFQVCCNLSLTTSVNLALVTRHATWNNTALRKAYFCDSISILFVLKNFSTEFQSVGICGRIPVGWNMGEVPPKCGCGYTGVALVRLHLPLLGTQGAIVAWFMLPVASVCIFLKDLHQK